MELTEKYENMKLQYRKTQAKFKEALAILSEYDGSRATDQWDSNLFPSREWESKASQFVKNHKR